MSNEIDVEYLRDCFSYDAKTGALKWRSRPLSHFCDAGRFAYWNRRYSGSIAGSIQTTTKGQKYLGVRVAGKMLKAHRVIWSIVNGCAPRGLIDHKDGNALNNKLSNLRVVNHSQNSKNTKLSTKNKTGIIGVYWIKSRQRWQSKITNLSGKRISLGLTADFFEACCRRKSAEIDNGYHINHGRGN